MYFQFLIEDESTKILVNHVMRKIKMRYAEEEIEWDTKFFKGIGHLKKTGNALGQKTGKLLNDLPLFMRAFGKILQDMGDAEAVKAAYPGAKMQHMKKYEQDAICDTWEVLADIVYPRGVARLKKKAAGCYPVIGKAKCEWADKIGGYLSLHKNSSPSYQYFIHELEKRITRRGIL